MADPRLSQSATRLSEDIGDVLSAIRRMIAEDEALSSTRDRLRAERDALDSLIQSDTIYEDAGEFLARRYGGNAALARQLAGAPTRNLTAVADESWPLGEDANAADAARPKRVLRHNEVVRSANTATAPEPAAAIAPLKLDQRVTPAEHATVAPKSGGWRSWIRPEPRKSLDIAAKNAIEDSPKTIAQEFETLVQEDTIFDQTGFDQTDFDQTVHAAFEEASVDQTDVAAAEEASFDQMNVSAFDDASFDEVDDAAFDEAFDWKERMRPELPTPLAAMPVEEPTPVEEVTEIAEVAPELVAPEPTATVESDPTATLLSPENTALRDLLREMIQEELQGEMGQRFSSNLRAVIRREVAAVVDQHLDRI